MPIFFTFLYSRVNFVGINFLILSPTRPFSFVHLQIASAYFQDHIHGAAAIDAQRCSLATIFSMSICLVVDVPQLKEDLLPVLIVAFLIQMGIQVLKQQRRVKALNFCKQAFIDLFQQLCLIPLFEHLQQENTFYTSLQGRTFPPAVFTFPWVQNDCMTFFSISSVSG